MSTERLTHTRRGFAIPAALLVLVAVAMIAGTTGWASWRAVRASRLAWDGDRALLAADEAVARTLAAWSPADFASRDVGSSWTTTVVTSAGATAHVLIARTAPLTAALAVDVVSAKAGPLPAHRVVTATTTLVAPVPPLLGALSTFAPVDASLALLGGVDNTADDCGSTRDTMSVTALHVDAAAMPSLLTFVDSARARAGPIERAAPEITTTAAPPWSPRIVALDSALAGALQISGVTTHRGLLVILGDLHVTGTLTVDGLLVVTGALSITGTLNADGAALVGGAPLHSATPTTLGPTTSIRYSRCSVLRALAAIARPALQVDWREGR